LFGGKRFPQRGPTLVQHTNLPLYLALRHDEGS
jgi:hypothetical protein